jgi:hypothetical protein
MLAFHTVWQPSSSHVHCAELLDEVHVSVESPLVLEAPTVTLKPISSKILVSMVA